MKPVYIETRSFSSIFRIKFMFSTLKKKTTGRFSKQSHNISTMELVYTKTGSFSKVYAKKFVFSTLKFLLRNRFIYNTFHGEITVQQIKEPEYANFHAHK